jgi:hypothetical protein
MAPKEVETKDNTANTAVPQATEAPKPTKETFVAKEVLNPGKLPEKWGYFTGQGPNADTAFQAANFGTVGPLVTKFMGMEDKDPTLPPDLIEAASLSKNKESQPNGEIILYVESSSETACDQIADGKMDEFFTQLGENIAAIHKRGIKVTVAILPEINMGDQIQNQCPRFKEAFRRVHDIIKNKAPHNSQMALSLNFATYPLVPENDPETYFAKIEGLVDRVIVSGFNFDTDEIPEKTFKEVYGPILDQISQWGVPITLNTGCAKRPYRPDWIRAIPGVLAQYPNVDQVSVFAQDKLGQGIEQNWSFGDPESQKSFRDILP